MTMNTSQPVQALAPDAVRDKLADMVVADLLGPAGGPDEELSQHEDRVTGRYLIGALAPKATQVEAGELDDVGTSADGDDDEEAEDSAVPSSATFYPNSIGMSFVVELDTAAIEVSTEWGRYRKETSATQVGKDGSLKKVWKRAPFTGDVLTVPLAAGTFGPLHPCPVDEPDVIVQGLIRKMTVGWVVTVFLVNTTEEKDRNKDEAWVFQPRLLVRGAGDPVRPVFVQRHDWQRDLSKMDPLTREETETLEMLYRNRLEFSVGHGVSVHVTLPEPDADHALAIETTFVPQAEVEQQTPPTPEDNPDLAGVTLDMKELADMPLNDLVANLRRLETAYGNWLVREQSKLGDANERLAKHQAAATRALKRCARANSRIEEGIALLANDRLAEKAFRFANRTMALQRVHSIYARQVRKGEIAAGTPIGPLDVPDNRRWRLFQLAFILLNLPAITDLHHHDRSHATEAVADLLWFATGGGKTEAYLGLTAFTLAIRRLQGTVEGRVGDHGIGVLMRYTLRLLTLQQFQRATALICACETVRRADLATWGNVPFRLGLWVGGKVTPNTLKMAAEAMWVKGGTGGRPSGSNGTPHQLTTCPWCGREIRAHDIKVYEGPSDIGRCVTYCGDPLGTCAFSAAKAPKEGLPVLVVDEDIYRHPPSLLIATVDKFAQMPWKGETQMLFGQVSGLCPRHGFLSPEVDDVQAHPARNGLPKAQPQTHGPLRPPDLIIQDELHLISGPLGSMVALYETAVDELCSWTVGGKRVRPKVVASTATIRRAPDQVNKLFLRSLDVFPPQGTTITDSFFAIQRPAGPRYPGRRYLGICAFGRRYPVAVIRVYTAVMAAAQKLYDTYDKLADPWMTVAGYFNSIRELAGTRRLVEDDIRNRLRDAPQRGLAKRQIRIGAVEELTSRKSSSDIPAILERLEIPFDKAAEAQRKADKDARKKPSTAPYDAVLATNMISVGVDIERLGLMVVAGQPKMTSEYIQATSRVGRAKSGPGLVVTLFNWARPRDLSHYESFEHYHSTFYKHVEALSVTPFSARALDKGLSGILVAMMRLGEERLNGNRKAGELKDTDPVMPDVIKRIIDRAEQATGPAEGALVRQMLMERRDIWLARVRGQTDHALGYQAEANGVVALISHAEANNKDKFACLNSLRDVEGTVDLILETNPTGLRV